MLWIFILLPSPSVRAACLEGLRPGEMVPESRARITACQEKEKDFERCGITVSRQDMANGTIRCAERYLSLLYNYLHQKLYDSHVVQADHPA